MTRVAVLMGGRSSEHPVSLRSGEQVASVIDKPIKVVIHKDGLFSIDDGPPMSPGVALERLKNDADVAFIAMHGPYGEDGCIQGALDVVGIPYTGSNVLGSALAMDKIRAKGVYRDVGLRVAKSETIGRVQWSRDREQTIAALNRLGLPCVIKPSASGSSVGVAFAEEAASRDRAIDQLINDVEEILIEEKISGAEFSCPVMEIARENRTFALPVIEIIPDPARFTYFDYTAKYTPGASQEITPARIPDSLRDQIQDLSVKAHLALGCRDFSRSDVLLDDAGVPVLLETNTIPGLTEGSLLPRALTPAGYTFKQFVEILIDNALLRGPTQFY